MGEFMIKKQIVLTALFLSFSMSTFAFAMENEELLSGKFLIKNNKHNEYLYLADSDRMSGDRIAQGSDGIFKKSIFIFEKNEEGYLIKNIKHDEYLYVADTDRIGGDRVVESHKSKMAKSYFTILKDTQGYKIKNNKHSEYLLLSNENRVSGDRVVKSWGKVDDNSFFSFVVYDKSWNLNAQ
jgi:hypothetical protein